MKEVILTSYSIKGLNVYNDKHGCIECSGKALTLHVHYVQGVQCGGVANGGIVAMYEDG